jgi:hypothetical protein
VNRQLVNTQQLASVPNSRTVLPDEPHFFTDAQIGMRRPFFVNDSLLPFGELNTKPSHDVHPCVAKRAESTSLPSDTYIYHNRPDSESLIQIRAEYSY